MRKLIFTLLLLVAVACTSPAPTTAPPVTLTSTITVTMAPTLTPTLTAITTNTLTPILTDTPVLATTPWLDATPTQEIAWLGEVTAICLRVRRGPGSEFAVARPCLPRGAQVIVFRASTDGDWLRIGGGDWVYGAWIKNVEENS